MFVCVFVLICGSTFIHRFGELVVKNDSERPPSLVFIYLFIYLFIFIFDMFGKFSSPVWNFFSSP